MSVMGAYQMGSALESKMEHVDSTYVAPEMESRQRRSYASLSWHVAGGMLALLPI